MSAAGTDYKALATAEPSATSVTVIPTNWTVALGCRNVTATDSYRLRLATAMTCGSVAHVELLFRAQCIGKRCPYRGEGYVGKVHVKGEFHTLAFSIRNTDKSNTVECAVNPEYWKDRAWSFAGLQLTPAQTARALSFCQKQLGTAYNSFGYNWNMFLGWFGQAYGVNAEDVSVDIPRPKRHPWFCSEFVAAALMNCGVIDHDRFKRHPCETSPQKLFDYFIRDKKGNVFALEDHDVWDS